MHISPRRLITSDREREESAANRFKQAVNLKAKPQV